MYRVQFLMWYIDANRWRKSRVVVSFDNSILPRDLVSELTESTLDDRFETAQIE